MNNARLSVATARLGLIIVNDHACMHMSTIIYCVEEFCFGVLLGTILCAIKTKPVIPTYMHAYMVCFMS